MEFYRFFGCYLLFTCLHKLCANQTSLVARRRGKIVAFGVISADNVRASAKALRVLIEINNFRRLGRENKHARDSQSVITS